MSNIKYGMPANPFDDLPKTPIQAELYALRKQIEMQDFVITALQKELDELKELTRWLNGDFENPTKEGEYNVFVSCANGDDPFYSVDKWSDNRGWSNFGWHKSDSDPDFELPQFFVAAWSSFHEIDIDLEQGE